MESKIKALDDSILAFAEFEEAQRAAKAALAKVVRLPVLDSGSTIFDGRTHCDCSMRVEQAQMDSTKVDRLQVDAGPLLVIAMATGFEDRIVHRVDIDGEEFLPAWMRKKGTLDYDDRRTFDVELPGLPSAFFRCIVTPDRAKKGLLIENEVRWHSFPRYSEGLLPSMKKFGLPGFTNEAATAVENLASKTSTLSHEASIASLKRTYEEYKEQLLRYEEATEPAPKRPRTL